MIIGSDEIVLGTTGLRVDFENVHCPVIPSA